MKNLLLGKTFAVLKRIAETEAPLTLKALASELQLSRSVVGRIAADLQETGLVQKTDYYTLAPGPGLLGLGMLARRHYPLLHHASLLRRKAMELKAAVSICTLWQNAAVEVFRTAPGEDPGSEADVSVLAVLYHAEFRQQAAERFAATGAEAGKIANFSGLLATLENGALVTRQGGRRWRIIRPFRYLERTYALELSGPSPECADLPHLALESKLLTSALQR